MDLFGEPDPQATVRQLIIPMKPGVVGDALFVGLHGEHRLWLDRRWSPDTDTAYALWAGLNPSRASAWQDDLTVSKEQRWTAMLGLSRYVKVNLFSLCSTDPIAMMLNPNRQHPGNLAMIKQLAKHADKVILSTGAPLPGIRVQFEEVFRQVVAMRPDWQCLGRTRDGWPRHSSRIAYATPFEKFRLPP